MYVKNNTSSDIWLAFTDYIKLKVFSSLWNWLLIKHNWLLREWFLPCPNNETNPFDYTPNNEKPDNLPVTKVLSCTSL